MVHGEVTQPNAIAYDSRSSVMDYVRLAGGTDAARQERAHSAVAPRRLVRRRRARAARARRRDSRAAAGRHEERRSRARHHADPLSARDRGARGGGSLRDVRRPRQPATARKAARRSPTRIGPRQPKPRCGRSTRPSTSSCRPSSSISHPRFAPLEFAWGLDGEARLAWCCSKDDVDRVAPWLLDGRLDQSFYKWSNEVFVLGAAFRWRRPPDAESKRHLTAWFERVEQYRRGVEARPSKERAVSAARRRPARARHRRVGDGQRRRRSARRRAHGNARGRGCGRASGRPGYRPAARSRCTTPSSSAAAGSFMRAAMGGTRRRTSRTI